MKSNVGRMRFFNRLLSARRLQSRPAEPFIGINGSWRGYQLSGVSAIGSRLGYDDAGSFSAVLKGALHAP
jgi:hypothetical protein